MNHTIDYRQLNDCIRTAGANAAIHEVKAGKSMKAVAEKFGTTIMTIHRWVNKSVDESISFKHKGRHTDAPKGTHVKPRLVNYRKLPRELVEIAKTTCITRVKAGEAIEKVAEDFGVSIITLKKWIG